MPLPITLRIARLDGGETVIAEAARLAEAFFAIDPSSRDDEKSFDARSLTTARNSIEEADVTVLNKSMRARTAAKRWVDLFQEAELPWLAAVDPAWDLIAMEHEAWEAESCDAALAGALLGILAPYRNVSVATKMLHFKRPRLVPVLDSLVVQMLGTQVSQTAKYETRVRQAMAIIRHLRAEGRARLDELTALQNYLAERGVNRPFVRILDALLWAAHGNSLIYPASELAQRWRAEDGG